MRYLINDKEKIKKVVKLFFKDKSGNSFNLIDGQAEIFLSIIDPSIKNLLINAPTRYGKSEITALALIYLAVFKGLKIPIIGGSYEKANIIMEYIIEHLLNHPVLFTGLINLEGIPNIERLKIKLSKEALRWRNGGYLYITSLDERNLKKEGGMVVGQGGDVVVVEEAGLIKSEELFSKVVRMPEGEWKKLILIGNCFENSIFEKAYNDENYYKVIISLDQAFNEGRLDKNFILNNVKKQMTTKDWLRFYEGKFPKISDFSYFKPVLYDYLPKDLKIYGAVDLSLGEKGSNYSAIVILGKDNNGQVYEVESIIGRYKPEEIIKIILNLPYKFERLGIEDVYFQRYFKNVIDNESKKLGKYIPFIGIKQNLTKEKRIESLEPFINTGQIKFKGNNELMKELKEYPDGEYIDGLDALEMAFRFFLKQEPRIRRLDF